MYYGVMLFIKGIWILAGIEIVVRLLRLVFKGTGSHNRRGGHRGYDFNKSLQQHDEFVRQQNEWAMSENEWAMSESLKSCTPFEHGGYDMNQGNSFNNFGNGMF